MALDMRSKKGAFDSANLNLALRLKMPSESATIIHRLLPLVCLAGLSLLVLSACGGGGGSSAPSPVMLPAPDSGGFTPDRERLVGFPASWPFWNEIDLDAAREEAAEEVARVSAMHARGGTGVGQTVGVLDLGANPGHPDLAGKYAARCAMGLCNGTQGSDDDNRPDLDRTDHSPLDDINGHGTAVHGVIAASKNGVGVFGVAHEAQIASYGNMAPVPWDDGTCFDCGRSHQWGGIFDRQIARGVDWMQSLGVRAANNSWSRIGQWSSDQNFTATYFRRIMPETLPAFQSYVAAGGVMVWAAGNTRSPNPDGEAVLPKYFPELQPGWLAVTALGRNGEIAGFSSHCGVAAEWCIAAPGELVTTKLGGGWDFTGGTSIAAPYVTAGLAALKSMFPNLSYHDIRERILVTADKAAPYDRTDIYGQGRLNLDAASRPIGGTNFALGTLATDTILSTSGANVVLPRTAITRYFGDQLLLVLDRYQRAPFEVRLKTFTQPRQPYLSINDLALGPRVQRRDEGGGNVALTVTGDNVSAQGILKGRTFLGFGQGEGVVQGLSRLTEISLPASGYRMSKDATGVTLGFAGGSGRWQAFAAAGTAESSGTGFGIAGWTPETVLAVSYAPNPAGEAGRAEVFSVSFASELNRPMGWDGAGALEIKGDSLELAWQRNVLAHEIVSVDWTNRLTHLDVRSGPLLRFDDALLASVDLEASIRPHHFVTVAVRLGAERPVSHVSGRIRVASSIDESGRIGYQDVALDGRQLMSFDRAGLIVGFVDDSNVSLELGIAAVRDGFGQTETLAGFRTQFEF